MLDEEMDIDREDFSGYSPLSKVASNMPQFFARQLRLRFMKVDRSFLENARWSADVEVWSVWDECKDEHESFVGHLYMDLLDRPGSNQAVNLQPGHLREDSTRVYPVTTLMCAFPRPSTMAYTLLKHSHLVSLFHEFGHCLHDLLSRTKYSRNHGYRVCLEFGEAIGTLFESCCWDVNILKQISCHYTALDDEASPDDRSHHADRTRPPREIPDNQLVGLNKQRSNFRLQHYLSQLRDATWDARIHDPASAEVLENLDEKKLYADLHEKYLGYKVPELTFQHVQFSHLVSGYDAGYYAYVYANCIAEELLQLCFPRGLDDPNSWERFRSGILTFGGSRDELILLKDFLGRPPAPDALVRSLDDLGM